MLYRIPAIHVILAAMLLALAGCGGNSASLTAAPPAGGVEQISGALDGGADGPDPNLLRGAAYVSPRGMALHRLDDHGFPCDPLPGELSVSETELADGRVEWLIVDNTGPPRPVFVRVRFTGSSYGTETIEAGDWGGEHRVIFAPFPTELRDLDIGVCPISPDMPSDEDCRGRTFARIVFEPGTEKTCSLGPWDKSGVTINSKFWHGFFPYTNPFDFDSQKYSKYALYTDHWFALDQRVEAVDDITPNGVYERDKLNHAYDDDQGLSEEDEKKVLRLVDLETEWGEEVYKTLRLRFYGKFHGDYNVDGWVNVSDITPIGQQWTEYKETDKSNYNAEEQASSEATYHNPYIDPGDLVLPNPRDVVDGSMDGYVSVPKSVGDLVELRNLLLVPPDDPEAQYQNDLSPIAVHFGESLSGWRIEFAPDNPDPNREPYLPIWQTIQYPPARKISQPGAAYLPGDFYYEVEFPLNWFQPVDGQGQPVPDRSRDLDPGLYDFTIRSIDAAPLDVWGDYGEATILRDYVLAFDQVSPPVKPANVPQWNTPYSLTADPGTTQFRSIVLEWSRAWVHEFEWDDQEEEWDPVPGVKAPVEYRIHVRVCPDQQTTYDESEVMTYADGVVPMAATGAEPVRKALWHKTPELADLDAVWIPGAKVAFVIEAINPENGDETDTHPSGVEYGYVSYDHSPPYWTPDDKPLVETENDIVHWSYGSNSLGHSGFYVYYGYALDKETGVSGYRLYYTAQTPAAEGGTQFTDAQLDSMLSDRPNHVIEYPRDATPGDPYMDYLTGKRCFFVEVDELDRYNALYVVCTAFNGEHYAPGSEPDFDNESINRVAHNLAEPPPNELFRRLILSGQQDGGAPSSLLNPDYYSGDMACKGWYEGVSTAGEGLVIGHVNEAELQSPEYGFKYKVWPNLGVWKYTSGDPLDKASWHCYAGINDLQNFIRDDFIKAIEIPPQSEISAEWVIDTMEAPAQSEPEPVVSYQVRANQYDEGFGWGDDERVYSMAASPESTYLRYYMDDYIRDDNGAFAYPMDLTPWSFGFAYYEGGYDTFFFPHYMDLYGDWRTNQYGFARDFRVTVDPQLYWRMGQQTAWTGRILMESVVPTNYFDYQIQDWSGMPRFATVWGASPSPGATPLLHLLWHNFGDLQPPYALSTVIPGQNPGAGMTPCFAATGHFDKGLETAYIVYTTDEAGEKVLRLAVTTGLGNLTDQRISAFPDVESYALNKCYYDLIDCIFGASVLDQRGGPEYLIGFDTVEGSWTDLEDSVDPSDEIQKQPLCVSFIQTWHNPALELPQGKELYYGEVYFDNQDQPYMWIELVDDEFSAARDNLGQQDPPDPAIAAFRPLWCAIGMIDLDQGELGPGDDEDTDLDRILPVISYGVRMDTNVGLDPYYGQLKVACPLGFFGPPADFTYGQGLTEVYKYGTQPDDSYPPGENPGPWPVYSQ